MRTWSKEWLGALPNEDLDRMRKLAETALTKLANETGPWAMSTRQRRRLRSLQEEWARRQRQNQPRPPSRAEVSRVMAELGKIGGKARAERLSPERRTEIALRAARSRWDARRARKSVERNQSEQPTKKESQ